MRRGRGVGAARGGLSTAVGRRRQDGGETPRSDRDGVSGVLRRLRQGRSPGGRGRVARRPREGREDAPLDRRVRGGNVPRIPGGRRSPPGGRRSPRGGDVVGLLRVVDGPRGARRVERSAIGATVSSVRTSRRPVRVEAGRRPAVRRETAAPSCGLSRGKETRTPVEAGLRPATPGGERQREAILAGRAGDCRSTGDGPQGGIGRASTESLVASSWTTAVSRGTPPPEGDFSVYLDWWRLSR